MKHLALILAALLFTLNFAHGESEFSLSEQVRKEGHLENIDFIVDSDEMEAMKAKFEIEFGAEIIDIGVLTDKRDFKLKYEGTSWAKLSASYYAKEFCSCIFVVAQSEKVCKRNVKQVPLFTGLRIDRKRREIQARSFFAYSYARYENKRHGCILVE